VLMYARAYAQVPKVLMMDASRLLDVKKKINQKDKTTIQLLQSLQKQADDLLNMKRGNPYESQS